MAQLTMARTTAGTPWLLLVVCLTAAATAGAQPDSMGFISIDCGLPGPASSVDDTTKLPYSPDAAFTDAGASGNISAQYVTPQLGKRFLSVRSFPDGARNCYTLQPLVAGLKHLLRAEFMYGNYDGLGRRPAFDLYVGVNFWTAVNVSSPDAETAAEAVVVVPGDSLQVCLVNTGSGTPFISALELRPLKSSVYPQANATQGLVALARVNFAPTVATDVVRYPDDPYDRVWLPWLDATVWDTVSTAKRVLNVEADLFEAPSKVMQTAITPRGGNTSDRIEFSWSSRPQPRDPAPRYILVLYFSELQPLPGGSARQFYININGELWYPGGVTPSYLVTSQIYSISPMWGSDQYNVSLNATANSTLPPIINAVEVFSVIPTTNLGTDAKDVSAIMAIKMKYRVQKNWMGDPCSPKTLAWDGLTCSYAISSPPRITGVNISFGGLDGDISSSFATLKAVQHLDLSHNNLTGSIPDALSQLPSLTVLDLTGNQLSGSIPPGLLKRIQDGSLNLRYGNNPNLCTANTCQTTKGKSKLAVYIAIPVALAVVIGLMVALFCLLRRKKQGLTRNTVKPQNEMPDAPPQPDGEYMYSQSSLQLENRRFTYKELEMITNNFQRVLGRGGFGKVYDGFLEDGTQVAVKLRSQSSTPGVKEFLSEAQILTRIADFGLSKVFNRDNDDHVSTNTFVGTPGYVDPEYQAAMQPTTKSDVYSFGVVLLELVTGRQAILSDPEPTSIVHWVRRRLARGNIDDVVDTQIRGEYDVNSVWKAVDIALKCTAHASVQRPTMSDVVVQLQECLELEEGHRHGGGTRGSFYTGSSSDPNFGYDSNTTECQSNDVSQTSTAFEMEHNFGKVSRMGRGPVAR